MGTFLEVEKKQQASYKWTSAHFSQEAKKNGIYRNKPREFCLPRTLAEENLYLGIRNNALSYFEALNINWHDGKDGKPSNHLCDSQVCCVNFLFPFVDKPEALKLLLLPIFPAIKDMLVIENDQYVAFEWIGEGNYLSERTHKNGKRTRGANFTSADAIVMFERTDGQRQSVLIEWKYTESYSATSLAIAKSGTDRTAIYRHTYDLPSCPIDKSQVSYEELFYEPFYQLLRQQLLSHAMERAKELGADIVSVLHIAPDCNVNFKKVTSPGLKDIGTSPTEIWQRIVNADRFVSVSTERLFGSLPIHVLDDMSDWWTYVSQRYSWIKNIL